MKKYELIKQESGFFRIKALKDFGNIKKRRVRWINTKRIKLKSI